MSAHRVARALSDDLSITVLGQGGASMGDLYVKVPNSAALETMVSAYQGGIRFYDTSPFYGVGLSEARFGVALHAYPRKDFVVQTKVGRHLVPDTKCVNGTAVGWIGGFHMGQQFDYSATGFQQQLHDSLQRTGLGYIDSLVIHDLEPTPHIVSGKTNGLAEAKQYLHELKQSGFAELQRMRAKGQIKVDPYIVIRSMFCFCFDVIVGIVFSCVCWMRGA